jgi:hypothetical protein
MDTSRGPFTSLERDNQRSLSRAALSALRELVGVAMERAGATTRSAEVHLAAGGARASSRTWVSRWLAGEVAADDAQVALLLEHCDSEAVAEAAAFLAGGTFVRGEASTGSVLGALAVHAECHAGAMSALTRAIDDGVLTDVERAAVLAALDAEAQALAALRARVAATSDGRR